MAITLTRYVPGDTTAFITKSNNNMTEIEGHDHNDVYYTETETNNLLDDKEDDLSNPSNDGDILSSTIAGVRSWVSPSSVSGVSGAAPETTATNKTLTSTNSGYQIATASIAFTLPDATTLTEQAFSYLFQNDSTDIVQIKNDSGEVLYRVPPNHQAILNLSDNATADGVWHEVLKQVTHIETLPRIVADTTAVSVKRMVTLDTTRTLVVYVDVTNTNTMAVVLTTQGSTIVPGTAVQVSASSVVYFDITLLDTDKALLTYSDIANSNYGTAVILSVSDTTVTVETAGKLVFESGNTGYMQVDKISTTTAMAAYRYSTTLGYAVILSVSGTTITAPSAHGAFSTNNTWYTDIKVLTSTLAVVAYYDNDLTLGKVGRIVFSGTSITTVGSNTTIPNSKIYKHRLEKLTDAKAILISHTSPSGFDPGAFVLDVTSSSVTVNTLNDLDLSGSWNTEIKLLDSETFVTCSINSGAKSVIRLYNVTGNVITEIDKKILDYNGKAIDQRGSFVMDLLYDNLFMAIDTDDDLSDYMVAFNFEVTK